MSCPVVIAIGASAGGIEALRQLAQELPPDLPAAVVLVVHVSSRAPSMLPQILNRAGVLHAKNAQDGEELRAGQIYIAPPDQHMTVEDGRLRLRQGPKENYQRPAIDVTFRSVAAECAPRAIGVILSGMLDDGVLGLHAIKQRGGIAIVQDPADALYPQMPQNALEYVDVDFIMSVQQIGSQVTALARALADDPADSINPLHDPTSAEEAVVVKRTSTPDDSDDTERTAIADDIESNEHGHGTGELSAYVCPNCGGTLWEMERNGVLRYRCHVGHVYTAESLQEAQADTLDVALWTAFRALKDSASLHRRMATAAREHGHSERGERFELRAEQDENRAEAIRRVLGTQADDASIAPK